MQEALARQPRAEGAASVSSKARGGQSVLDGLRQSGALKLLFPRGRPHLETIIINSAGGVTGGDRFALTARAGSGSRLVLTTQAAERAYRAQPGETGRLETRLSVAEGARLDWLPQELIVYDRAALDRRLSVSLEGDARLLMSEAVIFGRRAMGETLHDVRFTDRIRVTRDKVPIYIDAVRLEGDVAKELARPAIAGGAGAMAVVVFAAPDAEAHLTAVRPDLPDTAGASLLAPDLMVFRFLAKDGFGLRRTLLPVLDRLSDHTLPASWRL